MIGLFNLCRGGCRFHPAWRLQGVRHCLVQWRGYFLAALFCALLLLQNVTPAHAIKVLVLVNDTPITDYDVTQRLRLNRILGVRTPPGKARKLALERLIDEAVLMATARSQGLKIEEVQVEAAVRRMAAGMGGMQKLRSALRKQGLTMDQLRDYVRSQMLFQALAARYGRKLSVKVTDAEVERRLRKILSDPRLRGITIWKLRQVTLPVDDVAPVMRQQLFLARAVEAQQIMRNYRGCKTLRRATKDIFNVRVSPVIQADPRKLPAPIRKAISRAGTRHLVGPIRTSKGIQLIAFCGKQTLKPKLPDKAKLRQQLRAVIQQEKLARNIRSFMKTLRHKVVIDWRTKRS